MNLSFAEMYLVKSMGAKDTWLIASFFERLFTGSVQFITNIGENVINKYDDIFSEIVLGKRSVIKCVMIA